jgi:cyclophilin family peptidyl-prolyl cis-trans isomerase
MAQPATVVEFETSVGMFAVELYSQHAPRTCFNFAELAKIGTLKKNASFTILCTSLALMILSPFSQNIVLLLIHAKHQATTTERFFTGILASHSPKLFY